LNALNGLACLACLVVSGSACANDWFSQTHAALEQALSERYPDVQTWRIEPLVEPAQREWLEVHPNFSVTIKQLGKRSALSVHAQGQQGTRTLWFQVEGMQSVMSLDTTVHGGHDLEPAELKLRSIDVLASRCAPIVDPLRLLGMRAKRTLYAQRPICASDVEPRPLVAKGERVRVRSTRGAITVIGVAIAQADGRAGNMVRVKNAQSGDSFEAAVVGQAEVAVHE
jgi:flagella basal body P-ring formation protein FlgA